MYSCSLDAAKEGTATAAFVSSKVVTVTCSRRAVVAFGPMWRKETIALPSGTSRISGRLSHAIVRVVPIRLLELPPSVLKHRRIRHARGSVSRL